MNRWFRQPPPPSVNVHLTVITPGRRALHRLKTNPTQQHIIIPTELLAVACRQLFPAERLIVFSGRRLTHGVRITSFVDVTEPNTSGMHVRACPTRLAQALIDFDTTGAHFAMWMHSHPGLGPKATHPSHIDVNQEQALRQHYSERLVSLIAVQDGWIRLWGQAADNPTLTIQWHGDGLVPDKDDPNVFRLQLS